MIVDIKSGSPIPEKGSEHAACYDLRASGDKEIPPGATAIIGTGITAAIPDGYCLEILSRSGLASRGIVVANSPGIVDSDYRGELLVIIRNTTDAVFSIVDGHKIAQCRLCPTIPIEFRYRDSLDDTARGRGGLGSTGE